MEAVKERMRDKKVGDSYLEFLIYDSSLYAQSRCFLCKHIILESSFASVVNKNEFLRY